jgi:hypothetical protein
MLHVHCGDSSADSLRQSGVPGQVIVWTELLTDGPLRADVSEGEWRSLRAQYLCGATGGQIAVGACEKRLSRQDKALESFSRHEEVVLWFDACLFDQTILARHLAWFARRDLGSTKLSLICVGEFPGFEKFRGLGELTPAQLASLLPTRHPVSPDESRLGTEAWTALCSPDPTAIERLLQGDTSSLPYLHDALTRHLEQFPSTRNGLNRLENEALQVVAAGALTLGSIFVAVSAKEERPFFGDTCLWGCLDRLATSPVPVLEVEGPGALPLWQPKEIGRWSVRVTPTGREVLEGKKDWVRLNGIDRWLGGVHLTGKDAPWRWDGRRRRLAQGL